MKGSDWALIAVALISVLSAWLSSKSAKSAAKYTSDAGVSSQKVIAETEAYARARAMDTETIERQNKKIAELRKENEMILRSINQLREENLILHEDNDRLRRKIAGIEQRQENSNG